MLEYHSPKTTLQSSRVAHELTVVEESPTRLAETPPSKSALLRRSPWLRLASEGGLLKPVAAVEGLEHLLPKESGLTVEDFYAGLFAATPPPALVHRVRNPVHTLPSWFGEEIDHTFPPGEYDYVLSLGTPFGLDDFFMERLSPAAFKGIQAEGGGLLPNGCFNGLALPRSGRHYFSPELQRYCLVEHFEDFFDSPRSLIVNAVPGCNYRCLKCPFHSPALPQGSRVPAGHTMPVSTYASLLEKAGNYKRLRMVSPTLTGEPLAHPQIVELVKLTREAGFACGFTTNASLLREDMTDRLLEAGIGVLAFSVDAARPETYRRLQGGDLAAVEQNILYFQRRFREKYGSFLGTMSFVVSADNENEQNAYKAKWLRRGFHVSFFARHDWSRGMKPYFADNRWGLKRTPCLAAWHSLFLSDTLRPVSCSWAVTQQAPDLRSPSLLASDPALFWQGHPSRLAYRNTGHRQFDYCGRCSCWAETQSSMLRNEHGETVSLAFGSRIFYPCRAPGMIPEEI